MLLQSVVEWLAEQVCKTSRLPGLESTSLKDMLQWAGEQLQQMQETVAVSAQFASHICIAGAPATAANVLRGWVAQLHGRSSACAGILCAYCRRLLKQNQFMASQGCFWLMASCWRSRRPLPGCSTVLQLWAGVCNCRLLSEALLITGYTCQPECRKNASWVNGPCATSPRRLNISTRIRNG